MVPVKRIILATCSFIPHAPKATSFIPQLTTISLIASTRRHFVASSLLASTTRGQVCSSITRTVSLSATDSTMAFETGYLNAKDAAALDAELMSTPGFSLEQLMELAGLAVAEAVYQVNSENNKESTNRVLVVCGPGNNGGDGLVAARHLVHFGLEADIVYPKPSSKQHFINLVKQCEDMNIPVMSEIPSDKKYDIIVDSIFGFSFDSTSTIREPFATAIKDMIRLQKDQNATMISVDVPSGWDVDGGDLTGENFSPEVLISLTAPKMSAKKFKGRHFVGGRFLPPAIAEKYGVKVRSSSIQASYRFCCIVLFYHCVDSSLGLVLFCARCLHILVFSR
jgi:NAD(P)H-hydrate epimerase